MKPVNFLDKYELILFDLDGVITSEQVYWHTAALTVVEMLSSYRYFGSKRLDAEYMSDNAGRLKKEVFLNDSIIKYLKNCGVNTNWHLAYIMLCACLIAETENDWAKAFDIIKTLPDTAFAMYAELEKRVPHKTLYKTVVDCFQEWHLGEKLFIRNYGRRPVQPGKKSLMRLEQPVVDVDRLKKVLTCLKENGKRLGVGTGRPISEAEFPLEMWGIYELFDKNAVVSFSDVENAQKKFGGQLTKPHAYTFLRGVYGKASPEELSAGEVTTAACKTTLCIGDAGSDMFCAKNAGCDFCAVLTGVGGKSAREFFEKNEADYIIDSVLELGVNNEN